MAGIGQRFTSADHSSPWNTQSQCTMGRAVMHDCSKPVTTYGGNFNKRALFGNSSGSSGAPTFSDIATLCASGYNSRPGSSQHNGEILNSLTTAFPMRSYPNPADANTDNVSSFFNAVNYNGGQSGPPRNFSEPSLFPSLSSVNRTVGGDASNSRVGGALGGTSSMSSKPINDIMALSNNRTIGSIFSGSITCEAGNSSSTSVPPCSSRGVKLDPSEFPPILTSVGRTGNVSLAGGFHSSPSQPPLRNYVSVMSKGSPASDANTTQLGHQYAHTSVSQITPPEFSKQDFPALPGTNQTGTTTTSTSSTGTLTATSSVVHRSLSLNPASANSSGVGSTLSSHRSFTQTSGSLLSSPSAIGSTNFSGSTAHPNSSNGIQLLPNHLVTNIPKTMICDQFGMLGLLKLIRVGDYDATLNMLAPGLDLSSLHSNWQSPGELHNTFVSPCHDTCIGRPQDMDYPVPPEYLIRHLIADRLPDPPVDQLSEETLFWLFYNCCREEAQLVVAKELYQREWRFHKKEQIWLTRIMGGNFTTDNNSEHGDYYFWDPLKAQKSTHQMTILYSDLDNAPAAFRLSSGTLSAFVSIGMPGSGGANGHHSLNSQHSTSHSSLQQQQQQQLAIYQQQQQQYSHAHQQSLLSNAQATSGSGSVCNALHQPSGQLLSHTNNSLAGGSTPSAATLAGLLTARQQQQQQKHQQISPSASYFQAPSAVHGRSVGGVPPLFGPRSGTTTTGSGNVQQSTSPTSAGHLGNLISPAVASSVSSSQTTGSSGGGATGTATGTSKVSSEVNSDLDPSNLSRTQNQSSNANSDSSGPVHSSMFESSQQL